MAGGHEPARMCVICRRRFAKSRLLRHVLGSITDETEGETQAGAEKSGLEADEAQVRPGRGWYVCSDPRCREKFVRLGQVRRRRKGG